MYDKMNALGRRLLWGQKLLKRQFSVLSGISEELLISTSIGHQIGGRNNDELVDSMIKTNLIEKRSRVEEAFRRVDRAKFIPASLQPQAYENRPLKIGILATISTPQQHAQVITFLEPHLQEGMRALDIGCGSGFLVAVMAQLVGISGYIKGIDIVPELVHFSQENLKKSLENALISRIYIKEQKQGKFFEIQQEGEELYDCIHVGVAVETKAEAERFATMLKPGGGLLIPLGVAGQEQKLVKMTKLPNGEVLKRDLMSVLCQPMLDEPPKEIIQETRAQKLECIESSLKEWRDKYMQKHGKKPSRQDMLTDDKARVLFEQFASLRR